MLRRRTGAAALLALAGALAGCDIPKEVNPVEIYRTISGEADAGRPPPPGMDLPRPNLASVPPRPERPPPEVRDAISTALAANRSQSREPLAPRTAAARPGQGAAPRDPSFPAAPPPRPALTAAPAIPWTDTPPRGRPASPAAPAEAPAEPSAPPAMPDFAPAPPPPDLLGQPRSR